MNITIENDYAQVKNDILEFCYMENNFTVKKRGKEIYSIESHRIDYDNTKPPEHFLILGMMRFISLKTMI